MNIRQIEVFRKIMAAGSVTEAAQRLNVSQPAVSKHLRLMERDLGFDLFTRRGNQLLSTPEADALFDQVEQIYSGIDELSRFADDLRNNRHGELTVAAMPLVAQHWLPKIIADFTKAHDGVSISIPVRSTDWISRTVAAGRADIGIGLARRDEPGVKSTPLMDLPIVCVCSGDHALAGAGELTPEQLRDHQLITLSNFDRWPLSMNQVLEQSGIVPKRRLEVFTTQIACELALRGAGVAIVDVMSAMTHDDGQCSISRFSPAIAFQITMMEPKRRKPSRVASALVDIFIAEAKKTETGLTERLQGLADA